MTGQRERRERTAVGAGEPAVPREQGVARQRQRIVDADAVQRIHPGVRHVLQQPVPEHTANFERYESENASRSSRLMNAACYGVELRRSRAAQQAESYYNAH